MTRQMQISVVAVAALVLGGGGFVAGMTVGPTLAKTDPAASPAPGAQAQRQQAVQRGAGQGAGAQGGLGQTVNGRVISVQDGSITVETRQPGTDTTRSTIALVGSSSRLVKMTETEIKLADIKPGDEVLITGTTDATTGTVSASAVVVGTLPTRQVIGGERPATVTGGRVPPASASPRP